MLRREGRKDDLSTKGIRQCSHISGVSDGTEASAVSQKVSKRRNRGAGAIALAMNWRSLNKYAAKR